MVAQDKDKKLGGIFRPQDKPENKPFYVDAVRRNLGLGLESTGEPKSGLSPDVLQKLLDVNVSMVPNCVRTPRWICSNIEMSEVQKQLEQHDEIAIDFENNNEHSYLGTNSLFFPNHIQFKTVF